jgi:hypothetical protein
MNTDVELRPFGRTALHEASHSLIARVNGITVTGATLIARQTNDGTWVRGGDGTGIHTTGTHRDKKVLRACARACLAVALAGNLGERFFREQGLPEELTIESIIASTDTADRAEAKAAEEAIGGPRATPQIARQVFTTLGESRDALEQEKRRLLGFVERSAKRSERHGIRIEAEANDAHTYVAHRWNGFELIVDLVFGVEEIRTKKGPAVFGFRQHDGDWQVMSVPPGGSGLHYCDLVAVDELGTIRDLLASSGDRTLRARTNRPLTANEYADLESAGAIVAAAADEESSLVLSVPTPDVPSVERLINRAGWATAISTE